MKSNSTLLTDFYELTMLQAYFSQRMNDTAVFEFFARRLPEQRNFLMAAGLAQVVAYLTELRFSKDDLSWLRDSGKFSAPFLDSLHDFRFSGDVDAMPEGMIFFADEPIIRITAPMREAQFVESRVMNLLHYQTLVASKAARARIVAPGKHLIDFGLRRAHGAEAALLSARATYLAGFDGTATTQAGALFDIPVSGTMAHSFIQAHEHETDAFAAFARAFPDNATLLIDTYDTEAGAQQVVRLAQWLEEEEGIRIRAVRMDSGDLGALARRVRDILDAGGYDTIEIFASGNLDEYALHALVESHAPIDGFGIGTLMTTSADAPYLDCAYKLVEYAGQARRKRSSAKMNWPGRKHVYRQFDVHGVMCGDTLTLHDEDLSGQTLLQPVMRGGTLLHAQPALTEIRTLAQRQIACLPPSLRSLEAAPPYPVRVSDDLQEMTRRVDERQYSCADSDRQQWGTEAG